MSAKVGQRAVFALCEFEASLTLITSNAIPRKDMAVKAQKYQRPRSVVEDRHLTGEDHVDDTAGYFGQPKREENIQDYRIAI